MSERESISRRDLLRGRLGRRDESACNRPTGSKPDSSRRGHFPLLRPPGAVEEGAFLEGCTRCDACIEACPYDAIIHAPARLRQAAGTPIIDPIQQPCWMCADTPCIEACEPNVLRSDVPIRIGTAAIDTQLCLAHQNGFCSACWERCPVTGAMHVVDGKPQVVTETCTGCGVCQHVCPAPQNAVLLLPEQYRPEPPARASS